ncbi:hypothetical protein WME75_08370 [Sorangium sp. So ce1014]|uniref:hypothetical protein n=1 Tax=Sorangium sp. So ce1014 TaxID=3133326 RepID=UPI003F5DB54A
MYGSEGASGYVIPRYRAPAEASWYHVLHGNIPGHQIDFMYCPEVPQGALTTTHFSHLARLMKYIEPATGATHAFAIGNLSRDDTQHEPGHGAVGLIFGFRIGGAIDHAGRGNPPFAHGLVAVDRDLGYTSLLEASATFYRHVMNATEVNSSAGMFYREYAGAVREAPERVAHVLERYVEEFGDLPYLRRSSATWDWVADEGALPKRVVIVHKHDEPFGAIAHAAAKIAMVLYRSNIKWTSITSGREADIPGGVSVRFVRERDMTMEDRHGVLIRIEDLAEDEGEIARKVFGARPQGEPGDNKPQFGGWRERYAAQQAGGAAQLVQTAGGAMPAGPVSERGRAPSASPPAQRRVEWGEAHASEGPSAGPASQAMGPKGTLVIDAEQLLRDTGLVEARPGHAMSGGTAAGRPAVGGGAPMASGSADAARRGAGAGPPPLPSAAGRGAPHAPVLSSVAAGVNTADDDLGDIPIVVEQPRTSRKALWAVAGLGCAVAAGAVAWVVVSKGPGAPPAPPPAVAPSAAPEPERGTPGASVKEGAETAAPQATGAAPAAGQAAPPEEAASAEGDPQAKPPASASTAGQPRKTGGGRSGAKPSAAQQQRGKESAREPEDQKPVGAIQPKVKF